MKVLFLYMFQIKQKSQQALSPFIFGLMLVYAPQLWGIDNNVSYVQVLSDIPLAPGLCIEDDSQVDFDTMDGRLAEALAFGTVSLKDVQKFYRESLVALGWHKIPEQEWLYKRDDDYLALNFQQNSHVLEVHFRLSTQCNMIQEGKI